jgi:aminoglycoside phosphotransferase (APT) family kinase protein
MSRTLVEELDTWPEEWHSYADRLRAQADLLMVRVQEATRRDEEGFNVLTHGDPWVNNILFQEDTDAVRLLDFQFLHFTSPVVDLHYFLTTSAKLEVLVKHSQRLIQVSSVHKE